MEDLDLGMGCVLDKHLGMVELCENYLCSQGELGIFDLELVYIDSQYLKLHL